MRQNVHIVLSQIIPGLAKMLARLRACTDTDCFSGVAADEVQKEAFRVLQAHRAYSGLVAAIMSASMRTCSAIRR